MEATIFRGWIYDYLPPHAAALKVTHPRILRAIAATKKKNDRMSTPTRLPTACGGIFCRSAIWLPRRYASGDARCGIGICWWPGRADCRFLFVFAVGS